MLKVEGHNKLVRDPVTKAIINLDDSGLIQYQKQKKEARERLTRLEENQKDINQLKTDLSEIKQLLFNLLNKECSK